SGPPQIQPAAGSVARRRRQSCRQRNEQVHFFVSEAERQHAASLAPDGRRVTREWLLGLGTPRRGLFFWSADRQLAVRGCALVELRGWREPHRIASVAANATDCRCVRASF